VKYTVLSNLSYSGKTASVGDVVEDIPGKSVSWLLEQGHIVLVDSPKKSERKSPIEGDK
jgi:hypothetical protein